jgi:hypothetical protein
MSRHPSVRTTLIALASLSAIAVSTACGAPPDTENAAKGSEDLVIRIPWCQAPTDPISNESGPPDPPPNGTYGICGCYDIPVPGSLQDSGCTQGVALSMVNCDGTLWSGWVWACLGEGLEVAEYAASNGEFQGQLPPYEDIIGQAPQANTCYGPADQYHVLISESATVYRGCSPAACQGTACNHGNQ